MAEYPESTVEGDAGFVGFSTGCVGEGESEVSVYLLCFEEFPGDG